MKNVRKIINDIVNNKRLVESRHDSNDPIVDMCSDALATALIEELEEGSVGGNALEIMMGSAPDEERLTLARYEDIDSVAELTVAKLLRDPGIHDSLYYIVEEMLRASMEAVKGDY